MQGDQPVDEKGVVVEIGVELGLAAGKGVQQPALGRAQRASTKSAARAATARYSGSSNSRPASAYPRIISPFQPVRILTSVRGAFATIPDRQEFFAHGLQQLLELVLGELSPGGRFGQRAGQEEHRAFFEIRPVGYAIHVGEEVEVFLAENLRQLIALPNVKRSLLGVGLGVERRRKSPLRRRSFHV